MGKSALSPIPRISGQEAERLYAVTGLLLSYRFSSALARWDEGKKVWVALRSDIRDGIRMASHTAATIGNHADMAVVNADRYLI